MIKIDTEYGTVPNTDCKDIIFLEDAYHCHFIKCTLPVVPFDKDIIDIINDKMNDDILNLFNTNAVCCMYGIKYDYWLDNDVICVRRIEE